ncbi:MAG TPA: hypothetical protein DEP20_01010 [Fusobacteria bacterium]|nr:hypothetical protein [Fusobacteriota bacterium]|tara:strand:- start:7147 stop:7728 length:582 start_codon:yes stop_codon:yes gene_type:complete
MKKNIMLIHEMTPNPNAVRMISNLDFRVGEGVAFNKAPNIPMIEAIFEIDGVKEVFLLDNFITITKGNDKKWSSLLDKVRDIIENFLPFHDPEFKIEDKRESIKEFPPEVKAEVEKIEKILNDKVRPALQGDGGDLRIEDLEDNTLTISYTGACGSCPSATAGTLKGIEEILKSEYSKNIKVKTDQDNTNFFY